VQVSASEGLANYTVPESCAETREGFGEALTGAHRLGIEPRKQNLRGTPILCVEWKATRAGAPARAPGPARRGRGPPACASAPCAGTGRFASGQTNKPSQKYLKFSDQPIWLSLSVG